MSRYGPSARSGEEDVLHRERRSQQNPLAAGVGQHDRVGEDAALQEGVEPVNDEARQFGASAGLGLAAPGVAATARRESIYLDQRFSDHAPLTIDYDFKI